MILEAIIFDCDGVLVDTERDGHRLAFNMAFRDLRIDLEWSVDQYKELVKIAGGKERMRYFFNQTEWPDVAEEKDQFITNLHKKKTAHFLNIIQSGRMQLRPGVKRLIDEAIGYNIKLAVCSTSNENSVNMIVDSLLGNERREYFSAILAGDIVTRKKPSPDIYTLCAERLSIYPSMCVVVEDSRNGLLAAKAAGFNCLITKNEYTAEENFEEADMVIDELGDSIKTQVDCTSLNRLITNKHTNEIIS